MRFRALIVGASLLALLSFSAFIADDDPFTALLKKLDEFAKKYPQEKVHLHLDKPYYAIGDNIWFKAYVTDSRTSLPITTSNILYVELINDNDSLKAQLKLPMQSGITWGDFKLPDSLKEGNYRIRAYTQWMRNTGPNFFFDKTIKIGNAWANKIYTKTGFQYSNQDYKETVKVNIQFSSASASPIADAIVDYQVILGNKKIANKTTTDSDGKININLTNNTAEAAKAGYILATISLPDGFKATKKIPIKTMVNTTDAQFFPESGNLIEGLPCKVAVKAVNANGLGENLAGIIIDNEGTEVLTFETIYLGMGTFVLNPMPGKTYTAKIKLANGDEKIVALPKVEKSGYSLAVNNLDSVKMNIKVMLTPDLLNSGELNLVAHHNGSVLFISKVPTEKQIAAIIVPKTEFPSGIIQLTLFNPQQLPVCERVAFVNNMHDKIDVKFENLQPSYNKKSLVNLDLMVKNGEKASQGSFSVAVTNAKMVEPDLENESNILTSLLLTSELSGYVEKPNHYFLNNDSKTIQELDQLLLTQGWRKIDWSAVSGSLPTTNRMASGISFQAEKGMQISGVVLNDGKPIEKAKVSLMSSSKGIFAAETETDANGKFIFDKIAFNDSTTFALKAVARNGHKGVKIVLGNVPPQSITANKNIGDVEVNVNEAIKNYIQKSVVYFNDQESKGFLNRTNQLKAVEITAKANKASPLSTNFNGPGKADVVFDAEDLKNTTSLDDYLQGRVSGIERYKGKWYLTKNNPGMGESMPGKMNPPEPIRVYINGVEMTDSTFTLEDVPVLEIESIELLKSIANNTLYGTTAGVMLITMKTAKERTIFNTRAPGMLAYSPKGFYSVRQFYSPKYDVNKDENPDYRPTIFWEPNLVSDPNGKVNLTYYNTDQVGPVRIVIEGIDGDGNLARKVVTYEVE